MFDGLEIDMLSLGDADSILVTYWAPFGPQRILIDGGAGADADIVKEFLVRRRFTNLWTVVCTHLHNDHASLLRLDGVVDLLGGFDGEELEIAEAVAAVVAAAAEIHL